MDQEDNAETNQSGVYRYPPRTDGLQCVFEPVHWHSEKKSQSDRVMGFFIAIVVRIFQDVSPTNQITNDLILLGASVPIMGSP